ncbi:MAG: hypothetical protein ABIR47_17395 [Candidatus Kapaibacterium sp.]
MKIDIRIISLFALALVLFGCDTSEDPNLLNPPQQDSARVRVVNLIESEPVDVGFYGIPIVNALAPFRVSETQKYLILTPTSLTVKRPSRSKLDTIPTQSVLGAGAKVVFFVLKNNDGTSTVLPQAIGKLATTALVTRNVAEVVFINAVPDSLGTSYYIKSGCQSGDTLFNPTAFAQNPATHDTSATDLSLYLFSTVDSMPVASTHLHTPPGSITYLIAGRMGGSVHLFAMSATDDALTGMLPEAPPEMRTGATVELLNATADETPISARIQGGSTITSTLASLNISSAATVEACIDPHGDSLVIDAGSNQFKTPIRLSVGSRALVIAYDSVRSVRALTLSRDLAGGGGGGVYLRGVNVAPGVAAASISIGAGGDTSVGADSRPFGTLAYGKASGYVQLPAGNYPFLLSDANTGKFLSGGIQPLAPGFYTLIVVDRLGTPALMIVRDDLPGSPLSPLAGPGTRVTFFNLVRGVNAQFTVGTLQLPPLFYGYVYSTVAPYNVSTITSNSGQITIDPGSGGYFVGSVGTGSSRSLIAFRTDTSTQPVGKAFIRFINAFPNSPAIDIHIGRNTDPPLDSTATFGVPTPTYIFDERKYSFFVTPHGDTAILARADGVQINAGRHYLVAIGPRSDGTATSMYDLLVMQE